MRRALLLLALLLPRLAAAESLTLRFEPHPSHDAIVAGEMVPVTLRAVYDRKVAREALEIAASDSFDWIQTAPDHWGEEEIDGKSWIVMERALAIVPKRAGLLHFGPATHRLTIIDEASRRQERTVVAPPLSLSVGAFPARGGPAVAPSQALDEGETPGENGWKWVADAVTLTDDFSTDPSRLVDGETVTRRVTLRARGTLPELLPPRPVIAEPWLITFAAPVERRLLLTDEGPVSEVTWTWQFRPETGEPGVVAPIAIPFFNATTRRMDAVTMAAMPIGYASFYARTVQTGHFAARERLAAGVALAAGLATGAGLVFRYAVPDTSRAGWRRRTRRWSPRRRWQIRRAAAAGDLPRLRRLLAESRPDATAAAALVERALYRPGATFDAAAFRRALRRTG